jgi:hypothetical protein
LAKDAIFLSHSWRHGNAGTLAGLEGNILPPRQKQYVKRARNK